MEFDISKSIPLLTTKKVFYNMIIKELLWFVSGSTDSKVLEKQGVKIWAGNSSKEFLKQRKLPYREGDIGPGYGFQWRHWGAEYNGCDSDYKNKGIDQLQNLINEIKNNPNSRRLILSAWNVCQLTKMSLPPCHMMCQFNVSGKYLDCQLYQRSADMFLGVPFNIASYAIFTYMIAHVTGLKPRKLIHVIGDAHVYVNHVDQCKTQIERKPNPFPTLRIDGDIKTIDDFELKHFVIENYEHHPAIRATMAV